MHSEAIPRAAGIFTALDVRIIREPVEPIGCLGRKRRYWILLVQVELVDGQHGFHSASRPDQPELVPSCFQGGVIEPPARW
jgi:hypothetical protein